MKTNESASDGAASKMQMSETARLARNAYNRNLRLKNPERARELSRKHMAVWRQKNPERWNELQIAYWERRAIRDTQIAVTDKTLKVTNVTNVSKCQKCGSDLSDKRAGAKFCSTNCRVNFNRKTK